MSDRTIGEIVNACQEGSPATEEELRLTLLSLYYHSGLGAFRNEASTEQRFHLLKATPSVYLGDRWTPGTQANREGRAFSKGIFQAATARSSKK